MPLGSLISAGSNLIGGLLGKKSTEKANAANIAHQREFAQSGIQWRVADAEKAGVHPLFALGASTHSFAPSSVGDTSMQSALSNMGQDVGRAVQSTMSHGQKQADIVHMVKMRELQVQRGELENALLASKLATTGQVGSAPALAMPTDNFVVDGQGDVPLFDPDPRVASIKPPSGDVDAGKSFGLPLVRNPKRFSSGQWVEDEFGEGPAQWIHSAGSYGDAVIRALMARMRYNWKTGNKKFTGAYR